MTYCIVKGCQNSTRKNGRQSGVRLHVFPSCPSRIKLWLQQIGQNIQDLDSFTQRVMDQRKKGIFRICSIHFTPDSYILDGEKFILSKDAVPTIFPVRPDHFNEDGTLIQPSKKVCADFSSPLQSNSQTLIFQSNLPTLPLQRNLHPLPLQSSLQMLSLQSKFQASPLQANMQAPSSTNVQTSPMQSDVQEYPSQSDLKSSPSQSPLQSLQSDLLALPQHLDLMASSLQSDMQLSAPHFDSNFFASPQQSDILLSPQNPDLIPIQPQPDLPVSSDVQLSVQQRNGQLPQQSNTAQPLTLITAQQSDLELLAKKSALQLLAQQPLLQLAAHQPTLQLGNSQPTLQLEVPPLQTSLQLGASQPSLQLGASQPSLQLGASQPSLQLGASQPSLQLGASQPSLQLGAPQPSLQLGAPQPSLQLGASQPSLQLGASQPSLQLGASQPSLQLGASQPSLQLGAPQPSLQLGAPQPSLQLGAPQPSLQLGTLQPALQLWAQQPSLQLGASQPALQLGSIQPTLQLGAPPALQIGALHPSLQLGAHQLPLQLGNHQLPLQLGAQQPPLQLGAQQTPLQLGAQQLPLQLVAQQPPLQLGAQQPPLQLGAQQPPLQLGAQQPPFQLGSQQLPLHLSAQQLPLQLGAQQPPLQLGAQQPPLQLGAQQLPLQLGAQQPPLQQGSQQMLLQLGPQQPPLQLGTQQLPLQLGAQYQPLQLGVQQPALHVGTPQPTFQVGCQLPLGAQHQSFQLTAQQSALQLLAQQSALQLMAQQSALQLLTQQSVLQLMAQQPALQVTAQQPTVQVTAQQPILEQQGIPQLNMNTGAPGPTSIIPMRILSTDHGLILDIDPTGTFIKSKGEVKNVLTKKEMVDASTSTFEAVKMEDKSVQWPEFEFNFDGELWKIEQDHFYPSCFTTVKNDRPSTRHQKYPFDVGSPILTEQDILLDSEITSRKTFSFIGSTLKEIKSETHDSDSEQRHTLRTSKKPFCEREIETEVANERKFIVFESCLDFLFYKMCCRFGNGCKAHITKIEKFVDGSFLSVTARCQNGHRFHLWHSQPLMGCMAVGNILTAAAVLFSGSNFHKVYEMNSVLGLQQISKTVYDSYQNTFLFPTIDLHWQQECLRLNRAFANTPLTLTGDGQFEQVGHNIKNFSYTFMESATKRIVDFQIEPVSDLTSTSTVENHVFSICLNRLLNNDFKVKSVATGHSSAIKKIMHKKYRHLKHEYDVWHYAKGVKKHLTRARKGKTLVKLINWLPAISTHLWWSCITSQRNTVMFQERWQSLLHHVTNQHQWKNAETFHGCSHGKLTSMQHRQCSWLKKGTPAFHTLRDVVMNPQITKDFHCMSRFCCTEEMDVYKSFVTKYQTNRFHLNINAMEARTKLAALAYNANVHRYPIHTKYMGRGSIGRARQKHMFPKCRKRRVARSVYTDTFTEHTLSMMADVLKIYTGRLNHSWIPRCVNEPTNIPSEPVPVQLWTIAPSVSHFPVLL
ncbi:uncharacterized protein LOC101731273 [Xenopus tropicalis]|nr:uncharacterized protein LOC101731273 [Xenopus tropicalis]XP_031759246.1 uncharacterized protein LOC101731273 [Xenopus tropicalis]|eukprot:XP_004911116.1 PREDICTED: uncharacterized protein LOC101731273 [Xenopus tropicalis]